MRKTSGDLKERMSNTGHPDIDIKDKVMKQIYMRQEKKRQRRPLKIAIISFCFMLLFGGAAYASTHVLQLMNQDGEVLVEIIEEENLGFDENGFEDYYRSLEEAEKQVGENEKIMFYFKGDVPPGGSAYWILGSYNYSYKTLDRMKEAVTSPFTDIRFPTYIPDEFIFDQGEITLMEKYFDMSVREAIEREAETTQKPFVTQPIERGDGLVTSKVAYDYTRGEGALSFVVIENDVNHLGIQLEDMASVEKVTVRGLEGFYYVENGEPSLFWIEEIDEVELAYWITVEGEHALSKEELIIIAEKME
ncbi:hypothetical protein [Evansella tamaricis]|uniref:DUF4367 domain-containing protein n=1 Tax=Evansella tamaricis TaxID=2069301 RepID=A0ABS6JNE1_9BACI|nr:hypothetical protein [Evansella tamaricis]MBU9713828.1 hypothetical protein [Evansella tamaricis]